jgi:hypothetical protein
MLKPLKNIENVTDCASKDYNPLITKLIKTEYGSIDEYIQKMKSKSRSSKKNMQTDTL